MAARELGLDRIELRRRISCGQSRCRTRTPSARYTTAAPMRRNIDLALRDRRLGRLRRSASARRRSAASCSASASRTMSRSRSARRASAPRSTSSRRAASTSSSARSRAGRATRRASRRWWPICSACRSRVVDIVIGDTDIVQRRRRLAFRPLHAPCRDGHLERRAAS